MHSLTINCDQPGPRISRHIYGHFAEHLGRCIYEGLWVGEDSSVPNVRGWRSDLVEALRQLSIPNLRWPGGCFADTYHWQDGIGPKPQRPSMINVHWGNTTENNHVGTHEFLDLCEQLGCEPYIAGNVGSGTVREMSQWLEYLTMAGQSPMASLRQSNRRDAPWDITYWGVGNENWGCGGNMRPQFYADLYRQFACYCRHFGKGKKLYKVACGFWDEWNDILMRDAGSLMDGLSIHYYTVTHSWQKKGSATEFDETDWKLTLQKAAGVDAFLKRTSAIMDRYDPAARVGIILDEWGTWHDATPGSNPAFLEQQNTMRDALVAGVSLNIFHHHAARLHMANLAQTVNVLQAVALTDGASMTLTPTYHVLEMFKAHQDAMLLPSVLATRPYVEATGATSDPSQANQPFAAVQQISASASRREGGAMTISLCNLHHSDEAPVEISLRGAKASRVSGRVLRAPQLNAHNTFASPGEVRPIAMQAISIDADRLKLTLPAASVVVLEVN